MRHAGVLTVIGTALLTACATGRGRSPVDDPGALAALQADLRIVGGETTWVAHGSGYELVGRSKSELVTLQPQLDREAATFRRLFASDSLVPIVVTVRRLPAEGKPFVPAAPVPTTTPGAVVEVVLPDPKAPTDRESGRGRAPGAMESLGERTPTVRVARAWLSARASILTHAAARSNQANGETEDPRVPAWAQEAIPALGGDSPVDRLSTMLAAHPESLVPLSMLFTMPRPPFLGATTPQRGGGEDRGGGMGGGGARGGTGGRGGMGGRGGRGGMGGGGSERQGERAMPALEGGALFDAEAVVLGRYLVSREGYDFIGALVDAQILGKPVADVLAERRTLDLTQMETDWHRWLADAASKARR
jgi:uncharacterized membrane protein YgcG